MPSPGRGARVRVPSAPPQPSPRLSADSSSDIVPRVKRDESHSVIAGQAVISVILWTLPLEVAWAVGGGPFLLAQARPSVSFPAPPVRQHRVAVPCCSMLATASKSSHLIAPLSRAANAANFALPRRPAIHPPRQPPREDQASHAPPAPPRGSYHGIRTRSTPVKDVPWKKRRQLRGVFSWGRSSKRENKKREGQVIPLPSKSSAPAPFKVVLSADRSASSGFLVVSGT